MAARQKKAVAKPLVIATIYGKSLCTTAVVQQMVCMPDIAGIKRYQAINFIVTDIASHDVILGMAWL